MPSSTPVEVTTFVSPHLFWIFETVSKNKRLELEQKLKAEVHQIEKNPCIGDLVLVYNKVWKRAVVKEVHPKRKCWLIDYGVVYDYTSVYVLPEQYKTGLPALVKQAALDRVVNLKSVFEADTMKTIESIEFEIGVIKRAKQHITTASVTFFIFIREVDGIQVGQITLLNSYGQIFDLAEEMVTDGNLAYNDELFKEAFAINSKENGGNGMVQMPTVSPRSIQNVDETCKPLNDSFRDIANLIGLGRGFTRNPNRKEKKPGLPVMNEDLQKKMSVESWLDQSEKSADTSDALKYESDDDSKFDSSIASIESQASPKNNNISPTFATLRKMLQQASSERNKLSSKSLTHNESTDSEEIRRNSSFAESSSSDDAVVSSITSSKAAVKEPPVYCTNTLQNVSNLLEHVRDTCPCQQCQGWNTGQLYVDTKITTDSLTTQRESVKPPLLFKTDAVVAKVDKTIYSHRDISSGATQLERSKIPKILVHSNYQLALTSSPAKAPFHVAIHRALRSFDEAYTVQSYTWGSLMRGSNVCMVGPPKSGKTMAYLPVVCTNLLEIKERFGLLPKNTIGPLVIILCPNSKMAEQVRDCMRKLLDLVPKFKRPVTRFAIPPLDKKCLSRFQTQCDALVTTPAMLVALLRARIITAKRLCNLVIESATVVLERFGKEMDVLLNLFQSMIGHRTDNYRLQAIFVSENWSVKLETVLKRLDNMPLICVGSYLEAAMYGRVDIQMKFLDSKLKMSTLAELLKEKSGVCRTVVVCNNDSEIAATEKHLQLAGINALFLYDTMPMHEIMEMEKRWMISLGGKHLVLLCTDLVYNTYLTTSNAVLLVHYSLPNTWTQFVNRFSCMMDNYTCPLVATPDDWVRCQAHIFVDEACVRQFPKLMQLLQRLGAELPPKFCEYYKKTVMIREKEKVLTKTKLCLNLQLFGHCSADNRNLCRVSPDSSDIACGPLNCRRRHLLSPELDCSYKLPKSGQVKFKIVRIRDVTSFTVNLLEHTDPEGNIVKYDEYNDFDEKFQKAMEELHVGIFKVELHERYALYSTEDEKYSRCVVLKILEEDKITKMASTVGVRLLESGAEISIKVSYLYQLPEQFKHIPAQGVDMYIANLIPPDGDDCWSLYSKYQVKCLLEESDYASESVCAVGQVLLQLNNVLWLKNALLIEKLPTIDLIVTKLNMRKTVEDLGLAVYSEIPLQGLYNLCEKSDIAVPEYNKLPTPVKQIDKSHKQVKPQWAFFEDCDCNAVYIASVTSPSLFYVRLVKFYNIFETFQKEMQAIVTKPFYRTNFEVEVGKCYLVKDPESDDYCRAKVMEIENDVAKCFFVDFGDTTSANVSDIKYLPDELIEKLPFQVIECRLYGVQSVWDDWEPQASDVIYQYIFEPDTDYYRTLYTTTCKEETASTTGGKKCAVLLVDSFNSKILLINQLLIKCGEAVYIKDEDLNRQFCLPENPAEVIEENRDEIDDSNNEELTFEDIERLRAQHGKDGQNNNDNDLCLQTKDDVIDCGSNDSLHSWDIEINDAETFMKALMGIKENPNTVSRQHELPPMTALPSPSHCTPSIEWHQTATHIKFNINLPGVKDYKLQVARGKTVLFKTVYNGKPYKLDLQLFSQVEKTFQHSALGLHVRVILTKCTQVEWPRLLFTSQNMKNIRYDVSRCDVPEEKKRRFLTIEGEDEDIDGHYDVVGSDEDYSESDVESYNSD